MLSQMKLKPQSSINGLKLTLSPRKKTGFIKIPLFSKTEELHYWNLRDLKQRRSKNGLKLKRSKIHLSQNSKISFLIVRNGLSKELESSRRLKQSEKTQRQYQKESWVLKIWFGLGGWLLPMEAKQAAFTSAMDTNTSKTIIPSTLSQFFKKRKTRLSL